MRKYDRYDSSIPIQISPASLTEQQTTPLVNVSFGGLSCHFAQPIAIGDAVNIHISTTDPSCDLNGQIKWCRKFGDHYEVGVEFDQEDDPFLIRMVKQICHIEQYRETLHREEGRELSSEEAAKEWIEKFAKDFPH